MPTTCIKFIVPNKPKSTRTIKRQIFLIRKDFYIAVVSIGNKFVSLQLKVDPLHQTVKKKHCLSPSCVEFIPVDRNAWKSS